MAKRTKPIEATAGAPDGPLVKSGAMEVVVPAQPYPVADFPPGAVVEVPAEHPTVIASRRVLALLDEADALCVDDVLRHNPELGNVFLSLRAQRPSIDERQKRIAARFARKFGGNAT